MTWTDRRYRIEDTATDIDTAGFDVNTGWGRINADAATASTALGGSNLTFYTGTSMASIPIWPTGMNPTSSAADISTLIGGNTGTQILWWDPVASVYRPYGDIRVPRLGAGHGYWLLLVGPNQSKTYSGAKPYQKTAHPLVVHLKPGWNLIGTPANSNITFNYDTFKVRNYVKTGASFGMKDEKTLQQAVSANWLWSNYLWQYNRSTGQYEYVTDIRTTNPEGASHVMEPGRAYWIRVKEECELLIPQS